MTKKNVPLNALRTFEVAAKHRSFTRAGEELGVTQVAVSRQVKLLEEYLGVQLFVRGHRSIKLTVAGENLHIPLSSALQDIYGIVDSVNLRGRHDLVSVQVYTSFAQLWLLPRIKGFNRQFPKIEVRISASATPPDFEKQSIDAQIQSGTGHFPGCVADRLAPIDLVPICTPEFARRNDLTSLEDLAGVPLLRSMARYEDWERWLESCDQPVSSFTRYIQFENSAITYHAALEGLGVAMGVRVLARRLIDNGQLIVPFDLPLSTGESYYFVRPASGPSSSSTNRFREWLLSEAEKEKDTATREDVATDQT